MPNLAISLFRTLTSGTPGSLMTVVLPGGNVSHKSLRSLFDLLVNFLGNLSSREVSDQGMGLVSFQRCMKRDTDLSLSLLYQRPASTCALFIASLMISCSSRPSPIHYHRSSPQQGQYQHLNNDLRCFHMSDLVISELCIYR